MKRPLLAVLATAGLLAGCGTGLEAGAYKETGRKDGALVSLGDSGAPLSVRYLHVQAPALGTTHAVGGSVQLAGSLVNDADTADALVGASSDVAGSARLLVGGKPVTAVPVPAHGTAGTTWRIELVGLTRALHAGTYIPVTLSFAKAGRVELQVPVHAGDNGLETRQVSQDPYSHGEGAGHSEEAAEEEPHTEESAAPAGH